MCVQAVFTRLLREPHEVWAARFRYTQEASNVHLFEVQACAGSVSHDVAAYGLLRIRVERHAVDLCNHLLGETDDFKMLFTQCLHRSKEGQTRHKHVGMSKVMFEPAPGWSRRPRRHTHPPSAAECGERARGAAGAVRAPRAPDNLCGRALSRCPQR